MLAPKPASVSTSGCKDVCRATDYRLLPFTDDYGAALGAADLVLARAGGGVWEFAAAGKPAILVPYPLATADHQTKNARYFQTAGGAILVPESGSAACRRSRARRSVMRVGSRRRVRRGGGRPTGGPTRSAEELISLAAAPG